MSAIDDVLLERSRQELKWGEQNHNPYIYLAILVEEIGELAQAILHTQFGGSHAGWAEVRKETVHCAAVSLAIIECLDRNKWIVSDVEFICPRGTKGTQGDEMNALDEVIKFGKISMAHDKVADDAAAELTEMRAGLCKYEVKHQVDIREKETLRTALNKARKGFKEIAKPHQPGDEIFSTETWYTLKAVAASRIAAAWMKEYKETP